MTTTIQHGTIAIPEGKHVIPPTSKADMDRFLQELNEQKEQWLKFSPTVRAALLQETGEALLACAENWVKAACKAKGIDFDSPRAGEEWLGGPVTLMRNIRLLKESLLQIQENGTPKLPGSPKKLSNGKLSVPVFPTSFIEKLLYKDFVGDVWMKEGVNETNLKQHMAVVYRKKPESGKVALVLGAGNVSSIGPMDALYKLFVEDQVVLLKMNPVNEYVGPFYMEAFKPLVELGLFRVVYGGAAEGEYLCSHPLVEEIHITGSDKTHDAIVYGVGEEGARRKAERSPRNTRRVTSELGNVSPVIVVPGPWSQSDIDFQSQNLASMLANNAGFNCNAVRVIIMHQGWQLRDNVVEGVRKVFESLPTRTAYYPGAQDRWKAFVGEHPDAVQVGSAEQGRLPWTIVRNVNEQQVDDICLQTEAFCSVTSELVLDAASVVEYIQKAVTYCNDTIWGTLNASIIVHPQSMKDPAIAAAVEKGIADLRYGTITVNHWAALGYGFVSTPWGAYPGHELHDIQSGREFVHNTYMLENIEKCVIRGPFIVAPKPAWFVTNKMIHRLAPKLVEFELSPSYLKLPGLLVDALRG